MTDLKAYIRDNYAVFLLVLTFWGGLVTLGPVKLSAENAFQSNYYYYQDGPIVNPIDLATNSANQYFLVTVSADYRCIIVLKIQNYNIISVDSIPAPNINHHLADIKMILQTDSSGIIYWIQHAGDYSDIEIYSLAYNSGKSVPELLFRTIGEAILSPRINYNHKTGELYCVYSKFSDAQYYFRLDNTRVVYSKDFIRKIEHKSIGGEQQIQENGKCYVEYSNYFIERDTIYAFYRMEHENINDSLIIFLGSYYRGKDYIENIGKPIVQYSSRLTDTKPLGIIKNDIDLIYYWSDGYQNFRYSHSDDQGQSPLPRVVENGQELIDLFVNENVIAFMLDREIAIYNNNDSLIAKYSINENNISDGCIMSVDDKDQAIWIVVKNRDADSSKNYIEIKKIDELNRIN